MKVIKIPKRFNDKHPFELMEYIQKVVIPDGKLDVTKVYMSQADLAKFRANFIKYEFKGEKVSKKRKEETAGWAMLSYSPSGLLAEAIKPGVVVVEV